MHSSITSLVPCLIVGMFGAQHALAVSAKDGQGNMTVAPNVVTTGSTNDFTFRFRAPNHPYNTGAQASLLIPADWTAPQSTNSSNPGYVTVTPVLGSSTASLAGISGNSPWAIAINFSTAQKQGGFVVTYSRAMSPTNGGFSKFTAQTEQAGGRLREIRSGSPVVTLNNPAKTNTTCSIISSLNPCTYGDWVTFTATVTPAVSTVTGTVTFWDGDVEIGSVPLDSSRHATISTNRFSVADSPSSVTAEYSGNAVYNGSLSAILSEDVNPLAVTVSGLGAASKTYDGTAGASLDLSNVTLSGVLPGDDVTLDATNAIASFSDVRRAIQKTVDVSGLGLAGNDSDNYTILSDAVLQADILPAMLTVSANDTNRAFGAPDPAFTASFAGFVANETSTVVSGIPAFSTTADNASTAVGSPYSILVSRGTLLAANYDFLFVPGKLTISPGPGQPQKILSINPLTSGGMALQCSGAPSLTYLLQISTTLVPGSWTTIATNTADAPGLISFLDSSAGNQPARFYRTALP